ncbi:MAG TPA: metallophosphoesterase [Gemmatimonadaceae bacterium]|nr:metallophosphoesterase [Gemmatimonadaceae bacterium]
MRCLAIVVPMLLLGVACKSNDDPVGPDVPDPNDTTSTVGVRIGAAGNVVSCGMTNDEATASLLDSVSTVFALGDMVVGTAADVYDRCYDPSWGRHKEKTYAVLGNHEYSTGSASSTFSYFGTRAGPPDLGYYSVDVGDWHIIVLNDNANFVPYAAGSAQEAWLSTDLAANTKPCTMALWHDPLFLSSNTAGFTVRPSRKSIWALLYAANVDVVLNGGQHHYERMMPMDPDGNVDEARGVRQFNVGTGGESVAEPTVAIHANSAVRSATYGVLIMTLKANGYDWAFRAIPGQSFTDSGSGTCH